MAEIVSSFLASLAAFCERAAGDDVARRWAEESAPSGYSVGGLVAHVGAAVGWIGVLLETEPPPDGPLTSLGAYCAPFPVREPADLDSELHAAARQQGERGARRGPADTVAKLRAHHQQLSLRLPKEDLDRPIDLRPTLPPVVPLDDHFTGVIRLDDFLRTRLLDVVIHGDDLAVSVGDTTWWADPRAVGLAIEALVTVARQNHGDNQVLRALARRERTKPGVLPVL